ncbi:MAG: ferritin family protein [Dehalococcoidales bacterium]|nr:ferritin family protein [Dehalococcoidales bacterium]
MVSNLTLWEVLQAAIQKEVMSRFLYIGLRQRVKNPAAKEAFRLLADQEQSHQQVLENLLHGRLKEGALSNGLVVDHKITDCLNQPEISPTMELKEVFLVAAKKETASHDLYSNLAAIHPNGQIKHLLENLALQELEHKNSIESLYNEVAFPQTDGG